MKVLSNLIAKAPLLTLGLLPREAAMATVHYCIEADDMPSYDDAQRIFSNVPARLALIPVNAIRDAMMAIPEIAADFATFEDYHDWYLKENGAPRYGSANRWPCIASELPDEAVQDGSHRMHSYIRAGHDTIPVLKYDYKAWWRAHKAWKAQTCRSDDEPRQADERGAPRG